VLAGEPKLVIDKVKAFTQKPSVLRPPAAILLLLMNNTHTHTEEILMGQESLRDT